MMAQRKDQMRIIRQDAGFSARLGFGGMADAPEVDRPSIMPPTQVSAMPGAKPEQPPVGTGTSQVMLQGDNDVQRGRIREEARKEEGEPQTSADPAMQPAAPGPAAAARGQVVYVAVSLTARQARLADAWASAARCSVPFLIRRVAQGLREQAFEDWERDGMPEIAELRGARGRYPTSVTLTLRPGFAASLAEKHDPFGIQGLARVMGPGFRARFERAFDEALAKANIAALKVGDDK
jgi:hypothetical protein